MHVAGKEVACPNCSGGCCRDIGIELNLKEVAFMQRSGSVLRPLLEAGPDKDWAKVAKSHKDSQDSHVQEAFEKARALKKGEGIYELIGPCGNLIEKDGWLQCAAFKNPERPSICRNFKTGSEVCVEIFRRRADQKVELTKKPPMQQ